MIRQYYELSDFYGHPACRWDVLMDPSGLGQTQPWFFGLHPIILKNGPMSDWPNGKSLLFFPVVSTFVPREYRFRFPPLCANSPSLYTSVAARIHHHAVVFIRPRCIKTCTVAKRYLCVVSLYFALDAKQVLTLCLGLFKWRPVLRLTESKAAVACVCLVSWYFRTIKLFEMSVCVC